MERAPVAFRAPVRSVDRGTRGGTSVAVMVASAVSGEGKTSVSARLALSCARAGRRTVLVDSDLARPSLHGLLGVSPAPGLAEVLRGTVDVEAAIRPLTRCGAPSAMLTVT